MRYQVYTKRSGESPRLIAQGDKLAELSVLAESFHINNSVQKTYVYDDMRKRTAEDRVGDKVFECKWERSA